MMAWEMVLEAASQWSSTAAGRNDGGDLFPLDGSESPLSLFDFTPQPTARDTEIYCLRARIRSVTTGHLVAVNFWCAPRAHRQRDDKPFADCLVSVTTDKHTRY